MQHVSRCWSSAMNCTGRQANLMQYKYMICSKKSPHPHKKKLFFFYLKSKNNNCTWLLQCLAHCFHRAVPAFTSSPLSPPAVLRCVLSSWLEPGLENPSVRHTMSPGGFDSAAFSLPVMASRFLMRSEGRAGALARVYLRAKREGVCGFGPLTSLSTSFDPLRKAKWRAVMRDVKFS